nr:unnamed protein product [Callosobruchus analis]
MAIKRMHVTLTLVKEAEIMRQLDSGHSSTIYITRSTKKYEILWYVSRTEKDPGRRKTMRDAEYSDVEETVYAWFLQQRARHTPISEEIILQKARHFFTDVNYGEGVNFEASRGWFPAFKHRRQAVE